MKYYTLEQLAILLGKNSKTIYRAHLEYHIGKLYEVEEGRRLLFSESEYEFLLDLFWTKRRRELLKRKDVNAVISVLKKTPMTAYDLARTLRVPKSKVQSLLVAMTRVFSELSEDDYGVLYFNER